MFRLEIESSDGHKCGIPVQVDSHPAQVRPYVLNQIADTLLIDRQEILAVLKDGTEAELRAHLSKYTKAQLKPLHLRSERAVCKQFFEPDPA
jgi:hypothetical protein